MLKLNKVIHGDCLEVMKDIEDQSIDMILCDLPYGITACKWDSVIPFDILWEHYKRIIKDRGAIVLTASQPFMSFLVTSNIEMFKYEWVWVKPQGVDPIKSKIRPLNNIEYVVVFAKGKTLYNPQIESGKPYSSLRGRKKIISNRTTGDTFIPTEIINSGTRLPVRTLFFNTTSMGTTQEKGLHPTQKPVKLFEYLIKTYTNEGDLVLDNCAGSGTTGVACKNTNRNFILIEKEEKYCKIAEERLSGEIVKEGKEEKPSKGFFK